LGAEQLYVQVKSGKVKLDQLNDEGKKALKGFMENKAAAEKYGTNEQRAGSAMARQNVEDQQQLKQDSFNNTVYGGTNKLKSTLSGNKDEPKRVVSPSIEKVKQQADNLKKIGLASTNAAMAAQKEAYDKLPKWKKVGHDFFTSSANEKADSFLRGTLDTASVGLSREADKSVNKLSQKLGDSPEAIARMQQRANDSRDTTSYKVGQFGGYFLPGTMADRAIVGLGGAALKRLPKIAQGLIRGSASGALDTAAQEGGDVAFRGGKFDPINVALGAGLGGSLGVAAPLVKAGLQKGTNFLGNALENIQGNQIKAIDSVMNPPLPKAVGGEIGQNTLAARNEPPVLNSTAGRQPQPIKLDEDVIKFNESGTGDASTFGKKISSEPLKKKGSVSKWWEKTRTQLVDDMTPLEGVEKRVTGGVASAEDSLYKSARMFKGVPERAAQVVQQRLAPIVKGIEKLGHSTDDLGKYALAVHAKDVNAAGIKSGFTNAEIDDVIRRFGTPEMEASRQQLVQVNKDMMKELVDSGVVSGDLAKVLAERWKNYIPLFRAFDDESVEIGTGLSNALANVASPIKTLKGSERAAIDPLENMVKNIFQSVQAAERNKVASQLHRLADMDTESNFIRKLGEGEDVGRKNVVNVKVNGENVKYEVEPEVYKALLNLDKESSNMITNILSKPASLLRAGATLTPEFSLRNPMRDVVQAFVVSKSGFNPITDFGAGLIQTIKKGNLYKDWVDNLGAYGNVMSMDRNVHRQALEKVLKEPISKKFVNIVTGKSLIKALRYITDTTESATKVGEYRAALRKGVSKEEAAYRSRDIMDFARAGSGVRQANKMVAFLNANIQGKSKLIRAIKENPTGTITRAFTAVTLPTVGIFALNKQFANDTQRETIDNAPEWMRNSFWLMAIPGTDVVARIPKPFDLAAIFSNLPERALQFTYDNDKEAFDGFVSRTMKESALPMQISGLIPFIEGMANYSFFREGDIIPQREQGYEYSDQYDPIRTTETGKFLAKGAEKLTGGKGAFKNFSSPRVMDSTIQGLTAGLGKYGTDALDFILKKTGAVDRPVAPTKSIEQKPFTKAFLVDPNQGGKEMDKFYSTLNKLDKEKASNKLNDESFGKTGKKTDYLPWDKNVLLKELDSASDELSGINKEIRSIEKSTLLTADQKRRKIDVLIKDRKKVVKESVALIK
jgi:hypothetical protein